MFTCILALILHAWTIPRFKPHSKNEHWKPNRKECRNYFPFIVLFWDVARTNNNCVFCYTWIRGFLPSYYIDEKSSIVMICPTLIQLEDQDHCLVSAFLCSDDNQMVLCTRWLVRWTVSPLTAETCSQLSLIRQRQEGTQLMRLHLCFKGAGDGGGTPVCQPELWSQALLWCFNSLMFCFRRRVHVATATTATSTLCPATC